MSFAYYNGTAEIVTMIGFEVAVCPCTKTNPGTPIPSGCTNPVRLYDSKCVYHKTGCNIVGSYNQSSANAYCQANGMKLYSVLTALDYDLLEQLGGTYFSSSGTAIINGIQAPNGTWFAYNPNPQPVYTGFTIPTASGCLVAYFGFAKLLIKSESCAGTNNTFCEFY